MSDKILKSVIAEKDEEIERLVQRVEFLTKAVEPLPLKNNISLRNKEAQIIGLLCRREFVRIEALAAVCYPNEDDFESARAKVRPWITHVRKALSPYGCTVKNLFGQGYYMTPRSPEILSQLVT